MMSTANSISQVKPITVPIMIQIVKSEGAKSKHRPSKIINMPRNKSLLPEIFNELTKPSRNLLRKLGLFFDFGLFAIY